MSKDEDNHDDKFSFEEEENLDFTFSDIPVLGVGGGKKNEFSFDKFDPASEKAGRKKRESYIESYTELLKSAPAGDDGGDDGGGDDDSGEHAPSVELTSEELEERRGKWEKKAGGLFAKMPKWALPAIGGAALLLAAGAGALFFLSGDEPPATPKPQSQAKAAKPKQKAQPKTKVKTEKPAKSTDKTTKPKPTTEAAADEMTEAATTGTAKTETDTGGVNPDSKEYRIAERMKTIRKLVENGDQANLIYACIETLDEFPQDTLTQDKIQKYLLNHECYKAAGEIYKRWYQKHKDSSTANYLIANLISGSPQCVKFYRAAIASRPSFYQAYLGLARFYIGDRNYREAAATINQAVFYQPNNLECRRIQTFIEMRIGDQVKAVKAYQSFLRSLQKTPVEVALDTLPFAQELESPDMAESLIAVLKESPENHRDYRYFSIRQTAIYGTLDQADFEPFCPGEARDIRMMYLITQAHIRKLMLETVPPKYFPDFWKIYIGWKYNYKYWRQNAQRIIEKEKFAKDRTYSLIASVWLGKTSIEKALEMTRLVSYDKEPLFMLMMAEYYKSKGSKSKALVMYIKALKRKRSIYRFLALYLKNRR